MLGALVIATSVFARVANSATAIAAPRLAFVVDSDQGIYREIHRKMLQVMRAEYGAQIPAVVLDMAAVERGAPVAAIDNVDTLVVTVGTDAAYYAYANFKKNHILSTLITHDSFRRITKDLFGGERAAISAGVSAILLEQPIRRYFELGATLVPQAKSVGVLLGPSSLRYAEKVRDCAAAFDVAVELVKLKQSDNPIRGIQPVLKRVDYFIVLPDRHAFNRSVAKWVLQLSYRHRVPVIAFSKRYAEAGAIASVYSSADDIVRAASRLLLQRIVDPAVPNAVHTAEEFSVQLNRSVAKAIGIPLPVAVGNPVSTTPRRREAAAQ